jgi:ABC-type nitrate/sulfonate/bicarbonate transport system substrate-binding protein
MKLSFMGRRRFLAGLGAVAAVPAAGRPGRAATVVAQASPGALTTLRLGCTPSDDMTPIIYGMHAGLFQKAGLDIQVNKMTSGAAVANGVLANAFDIGKSSLPTLFEAHERNIPFTIIAPSSIYESKAPYTSFFVKKDAAIHAPKDIEGKVVGVSALDDIGSLALRAWMDQHGADPNKAKLVEVPLSAAPAAVEQGRIAVGESSYPSLAKVLTDENLRTIPAFDGIPSPYLIVCWFTTRDYSSKHADAIRTFASTYATAAAYTNAHHAETVTMMADFTGISEDVIGHMTRAASGTTLATSMIQPILDAAIRYGVIKKAFPLQDMIDPAISAR